MPETSFFNQRRFTYEKTLPFIRLDIAIPGVEWPFADKRYSC
jgi:hypothetical protein